MMHKLFSLNKCVLRIKNDAQRFLNGLTSNDMDKPRNAFLNIHGKIVATFDQIKIDEEEYLLVLEEQYVDSGLNHIERYRKLSGVEIINEKKSWDVFFDLNATYEIGPEEYLVSQKIGKIVISSHEVKKSTRTFDVSDEDFTLFRVKNNIPLQGKDYFDSFVLNVSSDDFVSFTKGCYLGQEPVSKVSSRSKPTWKLVVKNEDECSPDEREKMTSKINDPQSQRIMGFVFVRNN